MTDIVKGMVHVYQTTEAGSEGSMRAALLFLADNVSDEMVQAYEKFLEDNSRINTRKEAIALAIRAAAGEEGK